MNRAAFLMLLFAVCPLIAADKDWVPSKVVAIKGKQVEDLTIKERTYEIFEHDVKPEWGYKAPQQDNFVVIHPKSLRIPNKQKNCTYSLMTGYKQ